MLVCTVWRDVTLHLGLDAELERAAGEAEEMEERLDKASKDHPAGGAAVYSHHAQHTSSLYKSRLLTVRCKKKIRVRLFVWW